MPSGEPEQNVLSSQSSTNLYESLSILLFAVEHGLPSGKVPHRTSVMSEGQRYTYTKIRTEGSAGGQSQKVMDAGLIDE